MDENPTDAKEQFELAGKYHRGEGVPKDLEKAYSWYLKSAEQGYVWAWNMLSFYHEEGWFVQKDEKKAAYYKAKFIGQLTYDAEQGDAEAMHTLGCQYAYGGEKTQDELKTAIHWYAKAVEKFTEAADRGDADAQYKLSEVLENQYTLYAANYMNIKPELKKEARYWRTKAAENGHVDAQCHSGLSYIVGIEGHPKDLGKAIYWFTKAAEQGSPKGMCHLGDCDRDLKNMEKANYWYAKAAEQGNRDAMYRLGINCYKGDGIPKDVEKAKHWITLAAEKGHADAKEALTRLNAGKPPEKSAGCYVATCVYGSYDCPQVLTLRRYRDSRLSKSWLGRRFISVYYAVSPKVVELFGDRKWFNGLCKPIIESIVRKLQNSGVDSGPYSDSGRLR